MNAFVLQEKEPKQDATAERSAQPATLQTLPPDLAAYAIDGDEQWATYRHNAEIWHRHHWCSDATGFYE